MPLIKSFMIVLLVSSCTQLPGSFCSSYLPVDLNEDAAWAVIGADRDAAENIAVNEETYKDCP